MKRKYLVLTVALVLILAITALGCTAQQRTEYETYTVTDENGSTTYYINENGKWQDSNGNLGTYTEEDGTIVFFDMDGKQMFTGTRLDKMLALNVDGGTVFAVDETATEEEQTVSLKTVYALAKELGFNGTLEELIALFKGESAYEIAVENGFEGTKEEWLESLTGENGKDGKDGKDGVDGIDGVSISGIRKTDTNGNVDTYTISMTDGTKYTFTVTNGTGTEEATQPVADTTKKLDVISSCMLSTVTIVQEDGGAGSGIIYSIDKEKGDAYVITNAHMVYNSNRKSTSDPEYLETVKVYLYGSEVAANSGNDAVEMGIDATPIGACQLFDVAVVKITGSDAIKNSLAEAAAFADSDKVYPGQDVFVVGNANGYGISVAQGIVSKISQNVPFASISNSSQAVSHRVIRVDGAVNPGNSGGGIFNQNAEAIGIVIGKTTTSLTESLGYCIPSNIVLAVARNLITQYQHDPSEMHEFVRPLVGITIYTAESNAVIDDETGRVMVEESVKVLSVSEGMLADGKFEVDDVVKTIQINDGEVKQVVHVYTLTDTVMATKVGDVLHFTVERNGEIVAFDVTINEESMTVTQ